MSRKKKKKKKSKKRKMKILYNIDLPKCTICVTYDQIVDSIMQIKINTLL